MALPKWDLPGKRPGAVLLALGALLMTVGLFASNAMAAKVDPVRMDGNRKCQDLGLIQLAKFESPSAGPSMQNGVTINVNGSQDGFDWVSMTGVDAVIVKGSPAANVYRYDEEMQDANLITPTNPGGNQAQISHIEFCYDTGGAQPAPSPTPTPTDTSPPTTTPTSTPSPTTSPPSGTTSPSPGSTPGPDDEIPRTGPASSTYGFALAGLVLILVGLALTFGWRKEGKDSRG